VGQRFGNTMSVPLVVVNFKTYASASGSQANALAAAMEKQVSQSYRMVAVVSAFDLDSVTNENPNFNGAKLHIDF